MAGAAIFCLAYYIVIRMAMGKWNSTFAVFWLFAGIVCGVVHVCTPHLPAWVQTGVRHSFSVAFFVFAVVELRILSGMFGSGSRRCGHLIVLGAQVRGRAVTDSLRRRLERAVCYLERFPETEVIVSGGRGPGELCSEAEAMAKYLRERGIAEERIIREGKSETTEENLRNSTAWILDRSEPVGIVTNNFHMYRAMCYARRAGLEKPVAVPAGCSGVLFLNYVVREFFAVWKMWILGR